VAGLVDAGLLDAGSGLSDATPGSEVLGGHPPAAGADEEGDHVRNVLGLSEPDARPGQDRVIAGSSRLNAGTAHKIALNTISTSAMVRFGKTYDNLTVDVRDVLVGGRSIR